MIVTTKKPIDEVMDMIGDAKTVGLVGCGSCATACQTGGENDMLQFKAFLESKGKTVVAMAMSEYCCNARTTKTSLKKSKMAEIKPDVVVAMSCGDGVQVIANTLDGIPVFPSNNTMFLGEQAQLGLFEEACHLCGNCVLGTTGGICPIARCAKSLVNGPCGGSRNGKCEVNPENPCAWILIYERLQKLGRLDLLEKGRADKGHADVNYPRTINIRGKK